MKRFIFIWLMLVAGVAIGANVYSHISSTTNNLAKFAVNHYKNGEAEPDTAGITWDQTLRTTHSNSFDSGFATPTADADSGGIHLSWAAPSEGTWDQYILQYNYQGSGNPALWAFCMAVHQDSVTLTHDQGGGTDDLGNAIALPHRGEVDYRMYPISITGTDTTWSPVASVDTLVYNQSIRIHAKGYADDDVTVVVSSEDSELFVSYAAARSDTVGYGEIGANSASIGLYGLGGRIVASKTGYIESITFYITLSGTTLDLKVALTSFDEGNEVTTLADGELNLGSGAADGWVTVDLDTPYEVTVGTSYWLVGRSGTAGTNAWSDTVAGTPLIALYRSVTYANFPEATFTPTETYNNVRRSIYATYSN